jgi:hypothetical protein
LKQEQYFESWPCTLGFLNIFAERRSVCFSGREHLAQIELYTYSLMVVAAQIHLNAPHIGSGARDRLRKYLDFGVRRVGPNRVAKVYKYTWR